MDAGDKENTLNKFQALGLPQQELLRLHEVHCGTGQTPPTESPFRSKRPQIVNVPTGCRFRARFLAWPAFPVRLHWLDDGKSFPCFMDACKECPAPTTLYGYAAILTYQSIKNTGEQAILPAVLSLWQDVCAALIDLGIAAGSLVEFYRTVKSDEPSLTLIEETAPYVLPRAHDVRETLIARWGLRYWPDQGFGEAEKEDRRHG